MGESLKVNNHSNYLQQSVFIEGDSLYVLLDKQGQHTYVYPHEFTDLLAEIRKAEKSLNPQMLKAAMLTFDLANQSFKINDGDFQPLPNTPFKAAPSKPTIVSPPSDFEVQAQKAIGNNSRFKHLYFSEGSTPNFRELRRKDYDKIFVTFQFDNTTSTLILDTKTNKAYVFDPLLKKNEQRDKFIDQLKQQFRQNMFKPYETMTHQSPDVDTPQETETSVLELYQNMANPKGYDIRAFFIAIDEIKPKALPTRSLIGTYGDGNCGLHAFGEITEIEGKYLYKWPNGNPKELLKSALENLQNPIKDNIQILFTDAQNEFRERHNLSPAASNIKERYLQSLKDSSEHTGLNEILLFAQLVAKKNVTVEGYEGTYNYGFEETVSIRHIPNKNPKLKHWERVC
ncbi:MAG: hypothetical protein H7A40_00690 [Chlamydiales bacterium]|nr:hypothetical protein [Chlamydiales bacterium]